MKKALAGPAKRTAKKKPERRAMIAAVGRRIRTATAKLDRAVNLQLQRAWPRLTKAVHAARAVGRRLGRRLRPVGVILLRCLALIERLLLRAASRARRAATRASALLTPQRAICLTILASAACLFAAQFVHYRAVEIDQLGYAGLSAASAPTVDAKTAGQAHAFLLIPVALLAALLALVVMRNESRRSLGRVVFVLGAISLAVVLLVDLPAGLDAGVQSSRFAGAKAVLYDGFYAQIAAAAGLMLGGVLLVVAPKAADRYHARPCRTRTNLFARAASGLRRRRPRRASSQGKGGRRASRRRNGAVSAPASPR
jgi:hypothetical protein